LLLLAEMLYILVSSRDIIMGYNADPAQSKCCKWWLLCAHYS
jgi:hypothetical protein